MAETSKTAAIKRFRVQQGKAFRREQFLRRSNRIPLDPMSVPVD